MKIRIYGPCGSGKSYLADKLAKTLQLSFYQTDNMIWNRDRQGKFSRSDRQDNLERILDKDMWIIEGAQYKWSFESFLQADWIIYIHPRPTRLFYRVTSRFLKMQLGLEGHNYKQSPRDLLDMYKQNRTYYKQTHKDFLRATRALDHKMILINQSDLTTDLLDQIRRARHEQVI